MKDNSIWGKKKGSGWCHENGNPIRFPSRKRSKKVWKIFYKLFPKYTPSATDYKKPVPADKTRITTPEGKIRAEMPHPISHSDYSD